MCCFWAIFVNLTPKTTFLNASSILGTKSAMPDSEGRNRGYVNLDFWGPKYACVGYISVPKLRLRNVSVQDIFRPSKNHRSDDFSKIDSATASILSIVDPKILAVALAIFQKSPFWRFSKNGSKIVDFWPFSQNLRIRFLRKDNDP